MAYATARSAPRTLTEDEQVLLLRVTGEFADSFRDHMVFAIAMGTALREHEIVALRVGDVADNPEAVAKVGSAAGIKRRVQLTVFKNKSRRPGTTEEVFIPDALAYKLGRLLKWKAARGESIAPDAPLLVSRLRKAISTRYIRMLAEKWRVAAGFAWEWSFHSLRHTALTNAYRKTRDLRLVQRLARHRNVATTQIYAGPSDQDLLDVARGLRC